MHIAAKQVGLYSFCFSGGGGGRVVAFHCGRLRFDREKNGEVWGVGGAKSQVHGFGGAGSEWNGSESFVIQAADVMMFW